MTRKFGTSSSMETKRLGEQFARKVLSGSRGNNRKNKATVIALAGRLGAGKTTFAQGFARGMGIARKPNSPTFVIMRRYPVRARDAAFRNCYHIDAYRIKKADALETLGLKDIFSDPENIVLVEWPEHIKNALPKSAIWLNFQHGREENLRIVTVKKY